MSRPRTYTRTVLFAETFDFPTPPIWDPQSLQEARMSVSRSGTPTYLAVTSPYPLEPVDSWQAVQQAGALEHVRPITPLRLQRNTHARQSSSQSSSVFFPGGKPLSIYPDLKARSRVVRETRCLDVVPYTPQPPQRESLGEEDEDEDEGQQQSHKQVQPQHQWPWSHPHAPSPDCPCCSSHFTSRWSICSDESRPPSPSSSIHQRLRKMASSSTLRGVRSSIRLRLRASLWQLTRRH